MAKNRICSVAGCSKPLLARGWCNAHYLRWYRHGDPLSGGGALAPAGAPLQFAQSVMKSASIECIPWPFPASYGGKYGRITIDGAAVSVHRWMCQQIHGDPPTDQHEAAHSCGNSICCNPSHIRWATHAENLEDRIKHGTAPRGERAGNVRLTEDQVRTIRKMRGVVPQRELAEQFCVHVTTICAVQIGRNWNWLD